jgi:hypothetical protein
MPCCSPYIPLESVIEDPDYQNEFSARIDNCNKDDISGIWSTLFNGWDERSVPTMIKRTILIRQDGTGRVHTESRALTDHDISFQLQYQGQGVWTGHTSNNAKITCYFTGKKLLIKLVSLDPGSAGGKYVYVRTNDDSAVDEHLRTRNTLGPS